jgi:hypothetical protein
MKIGAETTPGGVFWDATAASTAAMSIASRMRIVSTADADAIAVACAHGDVMLDRCSRLVSRLALSWL